MFDFRWLRPNEAEHLQPYDRLNACGTRWPRRNGKFSPSRAPRDYRDSRDSRR
jgi:hypothetical protein